MITAPDSNGASVGLMGEGGLCRSLAARLSARVSELVLAEQQARMAQQAAPPAREASAMQQQIEALQARLEQREQVTDMPCALDVLTLSSKLSMHHSSS